MISPAEIAEAFCNVQNLSGERGFAAARFLHDKCAPASATIGT